MTSSDCVPSPGAWAGVVTVAVPAFGWSALLGRLLQALDSQAGSARLAVVLSDDGSPRPLAEELDAISFPHLDIELVRSQVNRGPGAARNLALAEVQTPWVAFIDADELPGDHWLSRLGCVLAGAPRIDAIEGAVVGGDDRATPFTHGAEFAAGAERPMGLGGNNVYRTEMLRAVGGFDESFYDRRRRMHFREDTDLYFRLLDAGARITHDPDLVVVHPPLGWSFWTPWVESRRYYFDPLLRRKHPVRFRRLTEERRLGPISLRRARHMAAWVHVGGCLATVLGTIARRRALARSGAVVLGLGWVANTVALSWRRRLSPKLLLPTVAVAGLTPWVYLWNYYRGVVRFRSSPGSDPEPANAV